MESARVRARLGGRPGGGLLVTSHVDIVFVGITDACSIDELSLPEPPAYIALRSASLSALASQEFIDANAALKHPNSAKKSINELESPGLAKSGRSDEAQSGHPTSASDRAAKKLRVTKSKPSRRQRRSRQMAQAVAALGDPVITNNRATFGPVVVSANARLSHANTFAIVPGQNYVSENEGSNKTPRRATLILSLDRNSFFRVGLPSNGGKVLEGHARTSNAGRSARHAVMVNLPAAPRAQERLKHDRIGLVDAYIAGGVGLGPEIPRPPPSSTAPLISSLRATQKVMARGSVPQRLADALLAEPQQRQMNRSQMRDNATTAVRPTIGPCHDAAPSATDRLSISWNVVLDSAQRILALGPTHYGGRAELPLIADDGPSGLWTCYEGVCAGGLEAAAISSAIRAVTSGLAQGAVVGALAYRDANVVWTDGGGRDRGDSSPGFGGDAALVTVVYGPERWITFELRAACDT